MRFIQPVSMSCTEEQYRLFLREPLLKMGYQERDISDWGSKYNILVTNIGGILGEIGNYALVCKEEHRRYYIETFNPKLFLAIAAMTCDDYGIPGEYWSCIEGDLNQKFLKGNVYRSRGRVNEASFLFDEQGRENGFGPYNLERFRKSTLEELVEQLTVENVKEEKNMAQESFKTTRQDLLKIWNIACSDWKERIVQCYKDYSRLFSEEVELPFEKVEQMFRAANETQLEVLRSVFPTYSENRNAWVGDVSDDEMNEISKSIFNDGGILELATSAAKAMGRPDLVRKALYVSRSLDVKIHKASSGGHVIEFIRK